MIAINKVVRLTPRKVVTPAFEPGDLIRHVRYGYRGVVVAVDESCRADPEWYMANKTQPDRDQPWYHVLVHGAETCTYAAQSSLIVDVDTKEIRHPFVAYFFDDFVDGKYIRNDHPWPDSK